MILESLLERQEVMELILGTQTLAAANLGSSLYHEHPGAGKGILESHLWFISARTWPPNQSAGISTGSLRPIQATS